MTLNIRQEYDCDTFSYWCSEEDYNNKEKNYGRFIEDGRGYEIFTKNTPRPWLNYLCNKKIASVFSNTGLGFFWYKTSLLRITRFEHPIDYQPRTFKDGREVILEDLESGMKWNVFRDAQDVHCIHRPGYSLVDAEIDRIFIEMLVFVPEEDACECWMINIENRSGKKRVFKVRFQQTWSIARFGIHTAEEGIPYISIPGKDQVVEIKENRIFAHTANNELPVEVWTWFASPQADSAEVIDEVQARKDGRVFTFPVCTLGASFSLKPGEKKKYHITSGAEENETVFNAMTVKYITAEVFEKEFDNVKRMWDQLVAYPSCDIPDKNMEKFLNIWFKNQMFVTFRYVRSGYIGYRDTIQDTWGYELIQPELTKAQILRTLSFMNKDGSCPRNYSPFGFHDKHDLRNTMDSATWIAMCISDYIKETGDVDILNEKIRYLDDEKLETVEEHIWLAFELLYKMHGMYDMNLVVDGDWNDAIEGISKYGPAVSVWLSIATYHAQNILAELYRHIGEHEKAEILLERSEKLKIAVNEHGWDGEWYIYAFSGKGNPIGSHINKEGKIHLNSNTWAVLSGIADKERSAKARASIHKYLDTPIGPALMYPPYVDDGDEVGRIARLEPGTFENASVYQHAVTFKIFADIAAGDYDEAYRTFANILPTNPENFDARRTSEPYCTGNYYCGPAHERFGQNFFTWFTGNAAWLLRAGFDEMLGTKADFGGLCISPKVPAEWKQFSLKRIFRGTFYDINFTRVKDQEEKGIWVDGIKLNGNLIPVFDRERVNVQVYF